MAEGCVVEFAISRRVFSNPCPIPNAESSSMTSQPYVEGNSPTASALDAIDQVTNKIPNSSQQVSPSSILSTIGAWTTWRTLAPQSTSTNTTLLPPPSSTRSGSSILVDSSEGSLTAQDHAHNLKESTNRRRCTPFAHIPQRLLTETDSI